MGYQLKKSRESAKKHFPQELKGPIPLSSRLIPLAPFSQRWSPSQPIPESEQQTHYRPRAMADNGIDQVVGTGAGFTLAAS